MRHLIAGRNAALCGVKAVETGDEYAHVFLTSVLADHHCVSLKEVNYVFPSLIYPEDVNAREQRGLFRHAECTPIPNFTPDFLSRLKERLGFSVPGESPCAGRSVDVQDLLAYVYCVLHSATFRKRYAAFLRKEFARILVPKDRAFFKALVGLGSELVALHLMESPKLENFITTYTGPKNPEVGRVGWSDDTVWLDAAATKKGQSATPGTIGFRGVPEDVWNFHIGGYQVCEKWLKDRKGRTLSEDDLAHYQKIVVALSETIRLMREIDEVIEAHGGWPAAFTADDTASETAVSSSLQIISLDDARIEHEKFKTLLPLYSLKAAAGYFGDGEEVVPEGWVEVEQFGKLDERMFVARAIGRSMETTIHDGDLLVFRSNPVGTRQGKIVLAQYRGSADPDTGGSFTVKKYTSEKIPDSDTEWRHAKVVLVPENPEYTPIIIPSDSADDFRILAEFITILKPRDERST
jgi:SOS-response transcriptional repressor LexA